jgi:chemosensory pili system protein ChpA (sensor histidine kinase/response regulator)
MTTPSSTLPQGARDFDAGSLSWVMVEIREALNRSKTALTEAIPQDEETQLTGLRHAKTYLHQAHGALQIVDIDGVAIITETVEDLLDRMESGQMKLSPEMVQTIAAAYQALTEYLEELLVGASHQPVRLFPYYKALLEVRGADRIHPADLFFPNLAIRPQLPPAGDGAGMPVDYVGLRQKYERSLLPFLKQTDTKQELAHAAVMSDIIGTVEGAQSNQQSRSFWWVMHVFSEAVKAGQVTNERYVKQLFARINLQIRRLCEGSPSIAERLLRDALFFIARVEQPSQSAMQVRSAYQLDGLVPVDYNKKRYGQTDADALAHAKERISNAKNTWGRITSGDPALADNFIAEMQGLADASTKLGSQPLSKLLLELNGIARHAAHATDNPSLGLEMATGLLFVENAVNHINHLPEDFSDRANALSARLLAVVSGETPAESAQWLDDMSRQAQQRQTVLALAGEMQTSLRQIEKMLDEYFRDQSQRAELAQISQILHQIGGGLSILDQEDAMHAIKDTQVTVQGFVEAAPDAPVDETEFQRVAQNVGALSFFIETLQLHPEGAKQRFAFDSATRVFHANLLEKKIADNAASQHGSLNPFGGALSSDATESALPSVEDELHNLQQHSVELAISLAAEPGNVALHDQLKESLEQVRLDATLVDDQEANDRAQAAINLLDNPEFIPNEKSMAGIVAAASPAPVSMPILKPAAPEPVSDEAVDAELLEIFLSEAVEVLDCVRQTLPASRNESSNQEHLTTLRRSFHTLKGSGRMVGLFAFGEAAWGIEQVLNLRLSEAKAGDETLYALLEKATEVLGAWVDDLQTKGSSTRISEPLTSAAERIKAGEPFSYTEEVPVAAEPIEDVQEELEPQAHPEEPADDLMPALDMQEDVNDEANAADELHQEDLLQADELSLTDDEMAAFGHVENVEAESQAEEIPAAEAEIINFAPLNLEPTNAQHDDNVKRIGDLEISVPLHNIYMAESDELIRHLTQDLSEWRHEPDRPVNVQTVHSAHSLAGSSATVGFNALQELAHALEMLLLGLSRKPVRLNEGEYDTLEYSVERLKMMLQMFALGEMPAQEPEQVEILTRMLHSLEARAADGASDSGQEKQTVQIQRMEAYPEKVVEVPKPPAKETHVAGIVDATIPNIETKPTASFSEPVFANKNDNAADPAMVIKDDLDADLLPVFLEEGGDMLPEMGRALRSWQQNTSDDSHPSSILRLLHTLKGSARMAGAMEFGQFMHEYETRMEQITRSGRPTAQVLEELVARHDHAMQLFDYLQNPDSKAAAMKLAEEKTKLDGSAPNATNAANQPATQEGVVITALMPAITRNSSSTMPAAAASTAATPATQVPVVRVRADILDRLVNQAGEVSISRSKLETEVGTLRTSLSELTENVVRLREQLREIEMQAETQITSRMAHSGDREFDPLEFDRFTRLQEITRMMAESVNDVNSVQQNITRTVENASNDLYMQARLTRDLQQDLMRVRMVQFASISERLYRVTRQASKEVDKRVNLDIRGSAVEMDRSVLEKMAGPFEHLLRNSIVHGIETRDGRRDAGKSEIGELRVEIRQEGNEVVIQFSDDGQGLNLKRIREKAITNGLLTNDQDVSDSEVTDMIFQPGFSTASEVTELAGRGIGMDVVRSEAAALGGRVSVQTEQGKGAHFTIHLPLTLAVTQVVVLSTGGKVYAVPSVLVEQVQQLKIGQLTSAYNDGHVMWQGHKVPMYYLSALLGDKDATAVAQQYSPLVILKSGNDRVAIHVDQIQGNREVVIKNIGPQLARMIGVAGATVLGSGEIVLILNPVPLAHRAIQESIRAPRIIPSDAPNDMGAVVDMVSNTPMTPAGAEPVQGLRTQHIIMVVDDSLTVRRVTQRLLAREGYQVVLAKDGVDALEQLQAITPDVMLVDIEMPRMDGFDLTRNVRSDERTRHIPIIMITSRTATKHRNYAMELGVNEYLGKPYQEDDLLKSIAGFISKAATVG